jgi:outer membrane protein assembly factor BamB
MLSLLSAPSNATDDWSRFRGANGSGISAAEGVPVEFGPQKNVLWEADVPFGRSSPVLAGDRIFLTATEDGAFVTLAIDAKSGKTLWKKSVKPSREADYHQDTDSATTTPVTDGRNVYAFFQEYGLVAYDEDGMERWTHSMGPFRNFYSIAASPIVSGGLLYMLCDQAEGSFLVAIDTATGKEAWRRNRPGRLESYSTPILYPDAAEPEALLIYGSSWIDAYEPKSGKTLWAAAGVGIGPVASPVLSGDTVYIAAPDHGEDGWSPFESVAEEYDKDGNGELTRPEVAEAWLAQHFGWLDRDGDGVITEPEWTELGAEVTRDNWGAYAVRLGGKEPQIVWNYRKNVAAIASPLVTDGVFYMVDKGILTALDAASGELIKRDRITDGSPKVYASPVAAGGKLYLATLRGTMVVVSAKGEWETLHRVDFDDEIWATPAIAEGRLFVRTRGKLYAFGAAGSGSRSDCVCPKEGRWNVQNLEGWMDCTGAINLKRKLKKVKDSGTIWVLEQDCSSVFGEASNKKNEDALMARTEGCGFAGTIRGEEDGVEMVIEITWALEGDEFIKGEMHSEPSFQGMTCEYYRPFEITFSEPIPDDEYAKLKKKMEQRLEQVRGRE